MGPGQRRPCAQGGPGVEGHDLLVQRTILIAAVLDDFGPFLPAVTVVQGHREEGHRAHQQGVESQPVAAVMQEHDAQDQPQHVRRDIDQRGLQELLEAFHQGLIRHVDDVQAGRHDRNLEDENRVRKLAGGNFQPMQDIVHAEGFGQDEDQQGQSHVQGQADVEDLVRIASRGAHLDVDVAPGRRGHRRAQEAQHRDNAAHDRVQADIRGAQGLEDETGAQQADHDDHEHAHPDDHRVGGNPPVVFTVLPHVHTIRFAGAPGLRPRISPAASPSPLPRGRAPPPAPAQRTRPPAK